MKLKWAAKDDVKETWEMSSKPITGGRIVENHGLRLSREVTLLQGISVTTIAHSFRNPLNAIRGAVTFIKEEYPTDSNLLDFAGIIEDEITRLEMLVSRLLSTSFTVVRRYTDINDLIKGVETATSLQANSRGIQVFFEYSDIPMVRIDAFQMEQAIRNIVNNAIEAMPQGGCLTVRTGIESDNVFIEVIDTGTGIHRLLFPYGGFAGNKGRGFGLYIARQILNIHGGRLMIMTGEGQGTKVKMLIPLKERREWKRKKRQC